ncbi:glycosyl hydrolase family 61-domain-containing protein [Trametes meyenii]|nr:glycosyl hydrolase family 61-domain-containing protein [Trametes meyenii]
MKATAALVLSFLITAPFVAAHGYVSQITVDGTTYKGNTPNGNSVKSPIRMIDDVGPVKGATNKYLSCGQNAQKALTVAAAKPGSRISFQWVSGNGGNWQHNVGPLMTYMASCGGGCAAFDSADAKWFKIAQAGRLANGTWAQAALMNGAAPAVQLPGDIAPGEYIIRHEIIALHTAMNAGGAEFYPSCAQLAIGGSGRGVPDSNATVAFPGVYADTDAGLLVDVYDLVGAYVFPGPAISNLAGKTLDADGSVSGDDSLDSEGGATSAAGSATSVSTESSSASATSTASSACASVSADEYEYDDQEGAEDDSERTARRRSRVMHLIS